MGCRVTHGGRGSDMMLGGRAILTTENFSHKETDFWCFDFLNIRTYTSRNTRMQRRKCSTKQ